MLRKMSCHLPVWGAIAAMLSGSTIALAQDHHGHDPTIRFTVKGMCCAKEAEPVIKELQRVKGVAAVKANTKTGVLTIEPQPKTEPSAKALWEAAERAKVAPVKLAMAHETFIKKPKK